MAHFAQIDENNIVTQIIVVSDAELIDNGTESEAKGMREKTRGEVQKILDDTKAQEQQEVQAALNALRSQAEKSRQEILDRTRKEIEYWEELFQQNHDKAFNFIIEQIISNKTS